MMKRKYENNLLFHVFNILEINYFLEKKLFFDSLILIIKFTYWIHLTHLS